MNRYKFFNAINFSKKIKKFLSFFPDFPKAVKRLLKNDILMFRTASSVLHILPIAGLYTFLPKYLESQFRLAAHHANLISGKYLDNNFFLLFINFNFLKCLIQFIYTNNYYISYCTSEKSLIKN